MGYRTETLVRGLRGRREGRARRAGKQIHAPRGQRAGAIISVLFFLLIMSILLMGAGTLATGHQQLCQSDSDYSAALYAAEAGVDYEFRKISVDPTTADQYPGTATTFGSGSYKVYCTNKDGTTPWSAPNPLYVVSKGTVNGISRTVKVSVKGFPWTGKYAIYTMDSISIWRGSSMSISGDVGSNGKLDFTASPTVNGSVYFDGPNAGWYNSSPSGYNVVNEPNPVQWATVDQIAAQTVSGGMATLATTNDNAKANPPIVGNSITSSTTLVGPGNYYVTNINLTGSSQITFDNTNGPVNIWVGPSGGTGTARFRGGTAAQPINADGSNACHIYVATQSGINLAGNQRIDALIYAYNKDASGNEYGYATNSGNPLINGQIIANKVDINGNITINYTKDLVKPTNFMYYGYDNSWQEVNPR